MGILSDTRGRKQVLEVLSKHCIKLCILSYIAGIVWLCALSDSQFNSRTYFSENALLPGMVNDDYFNHKLASSLYQELKGMAKEKKSRIPLKWLQEKMADFGLHTYTQNFTAHIPLPQMGQPPIIQGTNVYGVFRAPRIAGTEALVLSVPYQGGNNMGALALMLSLADHCRRHSYWSKDIIFLVTEEKAIGMQAWIEAYYALQNPYIKSLPIEGHSGSIQAAINLEMSTDSVNYVDILLEGLNGQLPNLDLINMVLRVLSKHGVPASLHTQHFNPWFSDLAPQAHEMVSMAMMMFHQASGLPSANHGLFHRFRVEAITLRGIGDGRYQGHGFYDMGRVLEGIYRSLNNLLERFHQSFFFYLLPAPHRYVSIGLYMPPFCCLLLGPLLYAVLLWSLAGNPSKEVPSEGQDKDPSKEVPSGGPSKEPVDEKDGKVDSDSGEEKTSEDELVTKEDEVNGEEESEEDYPEGVLRDSESTEKKKRSQKEMKEYTKSKDGKENNDDERMTEGEEEGDEVKTKSHDESTAKKEKDGCIDEETLREKVCVFAKVNGEEESEEDDPEGVLRDSESTEKKKRSKKEMKEYRKSKDVKENNDDKRMTEGEEEGDEVKTKSHDESTAKKEKDGCIDEETLREKVAFTWNPVPISSVVPVVMVTYLGGAMLFYAPYLGYEVGVALDVDPVVTSLGALAGMFSLIAVTPLVIRLFFSSKQDELDSSNRTRDLYLLKCAALILYSVMLASIAAMNFSLAFFVAVLTIPAYLFVAPTQNSLRHLFQLLLLFLASPPVLLFILCFTYNVISTADDVDSVTVATVTIERVRRAVIGSLRDSHLLGTWSFPMACLGVIPNWSIFWYLAWQ